MLALFFFYSICFLFIYYIIKTLIVLAHAEHIPQIPILTILKK